MQYLVSFLEGIITFVSPCLLPMLPIYISYLAGGSDNTKSKTIKNAFGFVLGFSIMFILLGVLASSLGLMLKNHQTTVNIITGSIVIILGLNFLGILKINMLNRSFKADYNVKQLGFFSSMIFGIVFSIGWTPCVGAFLGSALMLASQQGSILKGVIMLVLYSLGLGIPFILSAILIDRLKGTLNFIIKNYKVINIICGGILIIVGILMITGRMGYYLSLLSF